MRFNGIIRINRGCGSDIRGGLRLFRKPLSTTGFTLVEILITVSIVTFLIAGTYGILNVGKMTYYTDMRFLDLQQNCRLSMRWMIQELREAVWASANIVSIDDDNNRITFNTATDTGVQYYRDIGDVNSDSIVEQIIREYPAGTYKILANDIESLSFCFWHDDGTCDTDSTNSYLLGIQMMASGISLGKNLTYPLTVKVRLRNE